MARRRGKKLAALLKWHRRIGMTAALFVVVLAVTGLLLNHAAGWRFDQKSVSGAVISWLYDLEPKEEPVGYPVDGTWVIWLDGRLYLGAVLVSNDVPPVNGAVWLGDVIAVSAPPDVLLVLEDGRLLEKLGPADVPGPVSMLGLDRVGRIVARTGNSYYRLSDDFLSWSQAAEYPTDWSRPAEPPDPVMQAVLETDRGQGVTWQRLLLDLHTGRILGEWGVYVMDGAAILFFVLALTGVVVWWRRSRLKAPNRSIRDP